MFKKSIPWIIAIGVFAFIVPWLYKLFNTAKGTGKATDSYTNDAIIDKGVSDKTGIPVDRVAACRDIAFKISNCLETNKDLSAYDKATHFVYDTEIKSILAGVKSNDEARLVKSFYSEMFTNGNNLYNDVRAEINSNSEFVKIPFISSMQ